MTLVRLHPGDNVAVATRTLAGGTTADFAGAELPIRDDIPFGHKVATSAIDEGGAVRKYGRPIGRATVKIEPGEHVHVHNCRSVRDGTVSGGDDIVGGALQRPTASAPATSCLSPPPRLNGYRRNDGRVGIRNHLLVLATVQCANGVVRRIGSSVPGVVALPHSYGCSQIGPDLQRTTEVLRAFAGHPNVGAALLISLGCESVPAEGIAEELRDRGKRVEILSIQSEGGSRRTHRLALGIVETMLRELGSMERVSIGWGDLVVGVECGGSDAWSGITANPSVGVASDLIVAAGGTVVLSEVTEFIGAEGALVARAVSGEVGEAILRAVHDREAAVADLGLSLRGGQPTPGNLVGGITTIEEKSLGAIAKGGTTPVQEVLSYGRAPSQRGLVVMDTAGNDPESITGMVAGGAQIVLFTTGRGSPAGCPIAPALKIASNTPVYESMPDDMDLDAGVVLAGGSMEAVGALIFEEAAAVVNGKLTAAERGGHGVFAIERLAPRV